MDADAILSSLLEWPRFVLWTLYLFFYFFILHLKMTTGSDTNFTVAFANINMNNNSI